MTQYKIPQPIFRRTKLTDLCNFDLMGITLRSLLVNQRFALVDAPEHFAYN